LACIIQKLALDKHISGGSRSTTAVKQQLNDSEDNYQGNIIF